MGHRLVPPAPRAQPLRAEALGPAGPCEEDVGERLQGGEGGSAGEEERRAPAALEEEALHPHRGGAAPHPPQTAAAAAAAATAATTATAAGRADGQDQGAALLQHEDGGLRGAEGQVRVLHSGDGRGEGDRLSVRAGAGLERGDHAADGAVQEPPGHPRRPLHPAEAAAPGAAPRTAPPQRLQLRIDQVKLTERFGGAGLSAFAAPHFRWSETGHMPEVQVDWRDAAQQPRPQLLLCCCFAALGAEKHFKSVIYEPWKGSFGAMGLLGDMMYCNFILMYFYFIY